MTERKVALMEGFFHKGKFDDDRWEEFIQNTGIEGERGDIFYDLLRDGVLTPDIAIAELVTYHALNEESERDHDKARAAAVFLAIFEAGKIEVKKP